MYSHRSLHVLDDEQFQDNILVETVDNELRAVICDFGLALVEERLDNHAICSDGYRGTPGWSDTLPSWSEEEICIRSRPGRDIYAFGLVGLWVRRSTHAIITVSHYV
jgi:serine/threonine protein kinase